jgi:hypothetical protein
LTRGEMLQKTVQAGVEIDVCEASKQRLRSARAQGSGVLGELISGCIQAKP